MSDSQATLDTPISGVDKTTTTNATVSDLDQDIAKLREILQRRKRDAEADDLEYRCETRWVSVDNTYLEYYGFKQPKFCNVHWVNKTLFVVHRPNCKNTVKCHCCGDSCATQFLCIPCSGEINKSRRLVKYST